MPPLERTDLLQKAVLWPFLGYDGYGQPAVSKTPQEINVRWVDKQSVVQDAQGNTISFDVTIIVAQDVPDESVMWKGKLTDLPASFTAPDSTLVNVRSKNRTPDIKNRNIRLELGGMRYKDSLPNFG